MSAHGFFRHGLGDVPVFDDFAVLVEAEDVDDRFAALVRGVLAVDVDDNEGAFRHDALDVGVRLRVLLEEGTEGINKRLAAVGHARSVLDVGLGDVFFDRLVQLVLVEGEFVEGDDVFLVAREVVAGGKCQRCWRRKARRGEFFSSLFL